jgi:membrane protease YdiL (CAAX protease family)
MEQISPKQILLLAAPLLIIYAAIGQMANGLWLLTRLGVTGFWLDLGPPLYQFTMITILLCVIPMIWIKKKGHSQWSYFGSHKGNWKLGKILLCIMPIAIPMMYIGSNDPELIAEYPLVRSVIGNWGMFVIYEIIYALLYYIPYEFHFRGFLQLGLSKSWKPWQSILLVTIITTALHWMKPMSEIISAFIVGFFFGYLAQKTDSWGYIWAIHNLVGISTDLFCALRFLAII